MVYVASGDNLRIATGKLDAGLNNSQTLATANSNNLTTLRSFTGQSSPTDSSPVYSSMVYVASGDNLRIATGKLDAELNNINNSLTNYLLVSGQRAMAGDLNMSGYSIKNAKSILYNGHLTLSGVSINTIGNIWILNQLTVSGETYASRDITISQGYGVVLYSPDSTKHRIVVANNGSLSTINVA
jgi:hypothetical protein